jgi:hypothetical protein
MSSNLPSTSLDTFQVCLNTPDKRGSAWVEKRPGTAELLLQGHNLSWPQCKSALRKED